MELRKHREETGRMWMRRLATLMALLALSLSLATARAQVQVVPDQILVKVHPQMSEAAVENLLRVLDSRQVDGIPQIGVRIVRVPEARREAALTALQHNPNIEFAEADAIVPPDFIPNDPSYASQWHLPKIAAPAAWDLAIGSSEVIVAILDTGVDATHPDLAPLIVPGWNFYDNNADTRDVYGHGTSVAGSACAVGNNAIGIASVAWNCRLMPVRIASPTCYASYSTIARGLTYAADKGARVANVSFAGAGRSLTVQTAAKYLQDKGGVTTASGGNDGTFLDVPDCPYVLSVSATGSGDTRASFSNTGPYLDLAAPGSGIFTTANGGGYRSISGTSFAAPIVAGVAALVLSVNPALSAAQVQDILTQSADDLGTAGYDTDYGYGRVNAYKAVLAATAAPPPPADSTPPSVAIASPTEGAAVAGQVQVQVDASDDTAIDRVDLYLDDTLVATEALGAFSVVWDTTTRPDGACRVAAVAYDKAGNHATAVSDVTVRNSPDTTPPVVQITSPANGATLAKSQKITCKASDDIAVTRVELYANGKLLGSSSGSTTGSYTFTWNTSKIGRGTYTLQAVAYDAFGNSGISPSVSVKK
jgi:thermitase